MENDFLKKITEIVEDNISSEQFGVSELAAELGMSRSNLLRKVTKLSDVSVSQFIRQIRLKRAMELLQEGEYTVSEVSYKVGFGSTSYFIKCFGDIYGYPPGEVGKREVEENGQASQIHQLAAIMFTDIEGYTALMQQNEEKAIVFRNRHREVFNTVTLKYKGNILQYFGDGTLSTFNSAIDAVRCGIELQLAFNQEPKIPVRIGIHSGDIIFNEEGIIGDGVNVASRIESLATAGSVFISEKVYDEVKNQSGIKTASLGVFELKNVDKPLEVFAIVNQGLVVPQKKQINKNGNNDLNPEPIKAKPGRKKSGLKWLNIIVASIILGYLIYTFILFQIKKPFEPSIDQTIPKKSIAVLPFINDSNDSSNVYIINGLMESILTNLQKIEDLKVISRTSVEKYRNSTKLMPEIAKELNVNYFIEGSGQKIGDQILLNIQLIDGPGDKHVWAEQYNRDVKDIFKLQMDVAKQIATKIEVIITPEEEERINKVPTSNLDAYDVYLKGKDLLFTENRESIEQAIIYLKKAIELDNEFAAAYGDLAAAYFFLDFFMAEKKFADSINFYADKALFFDSEVPQGLVAKALFYMNNGEYRLAIPYLEKALLFNPNSAVIIGILADLYANYIPNTEKYLEYALKGIRLDIAANDSATASLIYLRVSNALIQSGFIKEAEMYINKSLDYDPKNLYSEYVKAYILYAKNRDLEKLKEGLIIAFNKDNTRLDIMQEIGKACFYLRDYKTSYYYYKMFTDIRESQNLNIYRSENAKIGVVYSEMGLKEESEKYFADYLNYAENNTSIYKHMSLAMYYSYNGDTKKAIEHLNLFSEQENYFYWTVIFIEIDPLVENIKDTREFKRLYKKIETKFSNYNAKIRASLEDQGLL